MTPHVTDADVEAAIVTYDEARCRLNEQWHGGKCEPMSEVSRKNIGEMFRAVLLADRTRTEAAVRGDERDPVLHAAEIIREALRANPDATATALAMLLDDAGLIRAASPAVQAVARPLAEWHEDVGPVLWWTMPVTEPPYVGTPLDVGDDIEITIGFTKLHKRDVVGGWPGYHEWWTPLPSPPADVIPTPPVSA